MLVQADSVGELLGQFKNRIPSVLIAGTGWDRLVERALGLPISLATPGFGFELRLHEAEPNADLGLALFHGSPSAAHFEQWARARPEDASASAVVGLLHDMAREGAGLNRIADAKLLLEYDIDAAHPTGQFPNPGIFLYPSAEPLTDPGAVVEPEDLGVLVDAVTAACGWAPDNAERRHALQLFEAAPAGTHIGAVGGFPDRTRALRVAVMGIRSTRELTSLLERAGWPGHPEDYVRFVETLEAQGAFAHLGAHLDITSAGIAPKLGVSYYARETQWVKGVESWTPIIEGLRTMEPVVPEKLAALSDEWASAETVFGRHGMLLVLKGIHHFKVTLIGDRLEEVKAYVFCLVFPALSATAAAEQ